jgi:hypothetical protein
LAWTVEPFDGAIHGLTNDGGRLVAVGRDGDGLASWTSTDGVTWERHDVPDPTFIAELVDDFGPQIYDGTSMGPMTRLGGTLFSFGRFSGPIDYYRPVGWRSAGGAAWEFIESESELYDYGAVPTAFAYHDGLVAALQRGLSGADFSLWQWNGLLGWQERPLERPRDAVVTSLDVALSGDDLMVAVGGLAPRTDAPSDPLDTEAVSWRSFSGERWERSPLPDGARLPAVLAPVPGGGFVVVARNPDGGALSWFTPDGLAWTQVDLAPCGNQVCDDFSITSAGEWLVATGSTSGGSRVWLSRDGFSWTAQDVPSARLADPQVAQVGDELLIAGLIGAADASETVLLRGTP